MITVYKYLSIVLFILLINYYGFIHILYVTILSIFNFNVHWLFLVVYMHLLQSPNGLRER